MQNYNYWSSDLNSEAIEHYGILGQKWGIRKYQYEDGSLTPEGRRRYLKGDGRLTRAGKKELERRNKILDYERGRRVLDAENAAKRGDTETVSRIKSISPTTSLDDTAFKKFEADYDHAVKMAKSTQGIFGVFGGINSEIMATSLANSRFTKAMGKYADPDDAIQDYIGWKGYGKESEWVSSHSPYNLVTTDKNGKTVRTPIQANTAEEAVDAYIKQLNQNTNKSTASKSSSSGAIKGISENDSRYGVMTKGLNGKDAQKYVSLWSKMKTMEPGWSVDDFFLNVDEREKPELYKTMIEFEKLHNKAYHNVHG